MPNYRVTIAGQSYEVQVPDPRERPVRAIVNGQIFEVEVAGDAAPAASTQSPIARPAPVSEVSPRASMPPSAATSALGDGQVVAPLPGTIVSISVVEGETVAHGQELCILEAMKMNNPIRATQSGVVREILVSVGEQVQHGIPLMVIDASGSSDER